jgi:hypothetical protein
MRRSLVKEKERCRISSVTKTARLAYPGRTNLSLGVKRATHVRRMYKKELVEQLLGEENFLHEKYNSSLFSKFYSSSIPNI